MVWRTIAGAGRMLGSLRLQQSLLDRSGPGFMVPLERPELRLGRAGLCRERLLLGQELVPRHQRDREEDQPGSVGRRRSTARWLGHRNQDLVL